MFSCTDQTLEYTDLDTLKAHAVDLDEAVREAKVLDEVKYTTPAFLMCS
jgi:hypothetical protein